ncbi:MAG TPA: helix-turn-helix domain-containing protein [Solirubrobacteraceae bacterium]|jgi:excisionase family DNA binding protein
MNPPEPDPIAAERYHTVAEIATLLRVTNETVRDWIASGALAAIKIGNRLLISDIDLNAFLRAQRVQPNEPLVQ